MLQLLLYVRLIADFVNAVLIILIEPINFFFPGKLPSTFCILCNKRSIDFLFPVCCKRGSGTTAAALLAGIPQVSYGSTCISIFDHEHMFSFVNQLYQL